MYKDIEYRKKRRTMLIPNLSAICLYVILTAAFNWSILSGQNIMKWDAMDFYYPVCMFSSDMLRAGKLPLWNAALEFGTPAYVSMSCLYWYPLSILLRLLTGYSLICVAIEYCFHIVLACYGMFLLAKSHLNNSKSETYFISAIIGVFYGFSGMFISNAEHLTIIINAAWLPYIFLFIKRYYETTAKLFLQTAALCMGLSILGGYPEVWVATFITLIPYFLAYSKPEEKTITKVFKTAITYIVFSVETFCVSAISVIPFAVAAKHIGRMRGRSINSYEPDMALSSILPHYTELSGELDKTLDISMISMFMGLLPLMLLLACLFMKVSHKWTYLGIIGFAFLMMLGNNAVLHPIFQKYFPLFSSLRFPSLWRCILTIFVLLLSTEALEKILDNKEKIKIFAFMCIITSVLSLVFCFLLNYIIPNISIHAIKEFKNDLLKDAVVLFIYSIFFFSLLFLKTTKNNTTGILILITIIDVYIGQCCLHPLTVTTINQWNLGELQASQTGMKERFQTDKKRTHSIEYNNAERTRSGFDSISIILNHTLDEEGYWLETPDYVENYKKSEHCRLSEDVPYAYYTNDVVDKKDVEYSEWISDTFVSPYQIYVEQKFDNPTANNQLINENIMAEHFYPGDILFNINQLEEGYLVVHQSYYPGWNVYVDGKREKVIKINKTFLGVHMEGGAHEIKFTFRPLDFYLGFAISIVYFILFILEFVKHIWYTKPGKIVFDVEQGGI